MKSIIITKPSPSFEDIKHLNEIGQEYWSAREFYKALDYLKWDKFLNVIDKAIQACENSGHDAQDHFPRMEKLDWLAPE